MKIKLSPICEEVRGKRIVLIDDSIVRGTTSGKIVGLLREAGASEIHMRISSPPFRNPCYYGTDIDSREHLIACQHTVPEIARIIGADSLYQLESWYHPEQVMAQAVLLVSGRTYEDGGVSLEDEVSYLNKKYGADIRILHNPKIEEASADIRKKAAEGRDLSKDMPAAVAEYIRETGLYLTK